MLGVLHALRMLQNFSDDHLSVTRTQSWSTATGKLPKIRRGAVERRVSRGKFALDATILEDPMRRFSRDIA